MTMVPNQDPAVLEAVTRQSTRPLDEIDMTQPLETRYYTLSSEGGFICQLNAQSLFSPRRLLS
jgi:hypothetical protein